MRGKDTFGDRQPPVIERRRFLVQAEVQKVLNVLDGDEKERAETLAFIKEDIRKDKELLNAEADKELSGLPEEQTDLQFAVFQTLEKYFSSLYQNFFLDVQLDGDTYKSHPDILEIYEDIRDIIEKYSDAFGKRFLFFLGKCGLDPATGFAISRLILKLCRELKTTTLVVTHDIMNFFDISDKIGIIHDGRIVAIGTQQEIRKAEDPLIKRFTTANAIAAI